MKLIENNNIFVELNVILMIFIYLCFLIIPKIHFFMNTIHLNSKSINNFFGFLYKMDTKSKKRLIIKLTESIEDTKTDKKSIASLFGSWIDTRDTESIIKEIRDSRTTNRDIIGF